MTASGINGLRILAPLSGGEEGDCGGLLFLERSWTADEWTATKIKSHQAVHIACYADPDALPDFAGFVIAAPEA